MLEEQGRRVGSVDKEKGGSPEGGGGATRSFVTEKVGVHRRSLEV
jgi:hypothetical protein